MLSIIGKMVIKHACLLKITVSSLDNKTLMLNSEIKKILMASNRFSYISYT